MSKKETLKDKILNTETYKTLTKMQKIFIVKRNNVTKIEHALEVIGNIGFEKWNQISNYHPNNTNIIQEIHARTN